MALNPDDLKRLKDAFNEWAKNSPHADEPAMGFIGTRLYSLREISAEIEQETDIGKSFLQIFEHGVQKEGIDKVIERIQKQLPKP